MPDANLLQKLKGNDSGLGNLLLFGRIRCMINTPSNLSYIKPAEDGAFAILDVFAIKCLKYDHFAERGSITKDQIYNTKGSVIIYLNKPNLVGHYVKVSGRTASSGVTVKQTKKHSHPSDGVVAFVWTRDRDTWVLEPNFVTELAANDSNITQVPFLEYVIKYIGENTEIEEYPVSNIIEFEGIRDYEEIDPDGVKGIEDKVHHSDEKIDLSKVDLKLVYNETGVEAPAFFYDVKDDIEVQAKARSKYAKTLLEEVKKGYDEDVEISMSAARSIRVNFIENVVMEYPSNVGDSKVKGRFYLEEFFKCLTMQAFLDKPIKTEKEIEELREAVLENPRALNDDSILDISDTLFAIMVIGISTGIGFERLARNYKTVCRVASDTSIDLWFYMMMSNPYLLSIMGSCVKYTEADIIYHSYPRFFSVSIIDVKGCTEMRRALIYLQVLENLAEEDSIVSKLSVKNFPYHYKGNEFVMKNRFMVKKDLVELIRVICGVKSIALNEKDIQKLWSDDWKNSKTLDILTENGIVNSIDDGLILETDLEKEALIFEVFQKKGMELTGITQEQCDSVCKEFEDKVGFNLESLQKSGVGLIKYKSAVLTGCAGSGKTTTSDGMVMGLEKYLKGYKLVYCAPTGKAARRMAEVLGRMVKTVHSEFKIGVGATDSYLGRISKKSKSGDDDSSIKGRIYLIDESGMLNRQLLYEIARALKPEDIIYFLGDIKQLPPIGTGCPFYNLMAILPCVELGVSKRAAEGSLINYNTTLINCLSDGVMEGCMFDDSTFLAVDCSNEAIASHLLNLWKRFMSEPDNKGKVYKEDDIQVITAYAKPECLYSSTTLNPILQKFLRRNDAHCFRHGDTDFFKNDRVIHANLNLYGMKRFAKTSPMVYEEVLSCGVVNGELGKIVGCYDSRQFTLTELDEETAESIQVGDTFYENVTEEELKELKEIRKTYSESISTLSNWVNENTWFVIVEVFDVNLKMPVYIFYDGRIHSQDGIIMLTGGMLGNLELAYALTCHKMQGSQIPVALVPVGSDSNPNFVNRNMLNTEITRAQKVVAMVGDIVDNDSAFNKGRTKVARYRTESVLSMLCDDARVLNK